MDHKITGRYAKALFAQTQKNGVTGKVQNDLAGVVHSLRLKERPWDLLQNPLVAREDKNEAIAAAFENRIQPITVRLLQTLASRTKLNLLPAIAQQLGHLADEAAGIVRAQVRSAFDLTSEEQTRLEKALGSLTGKKVVLETRQDPGLIAGLCVKTGDRLFEWSVKRQLRHLKETLSPA